MKHYSIEEQKRTVVVITAVLVSVGFTLTLAALFLIFLPTG